MYRIHRDCQKFDENLINFTAEVAEEKGTEKEFHVLKFEKFSASFAFSAVKYFDFTYS
jgi:hypothetical protein